MIPKFLEDSLCTYRNEELGLPAGHGCDSGKTHKGLGRRQGDNAVTLPDTPRLVPAPRPGAVGSTRVLGLVGRPRLHGDRMTSGGLHRPPQRLMADLDLGSDLGPGVEGKAAGPALCTESVASLQGAVAWGWALPANAPSSPCGNSVCFRSRNMRSIRCSLLRFSKQTSSVKAKSGGRGGG